MRARIFFVLCLPLAGCASIFSGSSKDVEVRAPPDALVEVVKAKAPGMPVYRGPPGKVHLDTGYSYQVTVKRSGRDDLILPLDRSLDGATFLNILWVIPILWGVGVAVDMATGAFWTIPGHLDTRWPELPPVLCPPPPPAPPMPPPPPALPPAPPTQL
jgi:hypothetical protein